MLTAEIFTISRIWKQPKCLLIDEYIRKCERDIYIYMYVCIYICVCVCILSCFSHVRFFVTQWTVACQAPLSMGFYRQEYWCGLPFPSLGDLPDPLTQGSNLPFLCLLYYRWVLYLWATGKPAYMYISSVAQSCPTLSDPMNCSMPGLPVHHQFPEFTQIHIHWVGDAIQPSHPLSSPLPPAPNPSQHQSLFQWINSSHEVAKVLEFQL